MKTLLVDFGALTEGILILKVKNFASTSKPELVGFGLNCKRAVWGISEIRNYREIKT